MNLSFAKQVIQKVDRLNSFEDALDLVGTSFQSNKATVLSFINAHGYNVCCTNKEFRNAILNSDLVFRDGIGMQLLFGAVDIKAGENLNGTDLIPEILKRFKGETIAILGTDQKYIRKAAEKLTAQGYNIVDYETGYCSDNHYLELMQRARPKIIVLGMGMPKQERVSMLLREQLQHNCLIINGGAILDFWGAKIFRAPMWIRKIKFEWAFRLAQEPTRLFSRYLIGNTKFLLRVNTLRRSKVIAKKQLSFCEMRPIFSDSLKDNTGISFES